MGHYREPVKYTCPDIDRVLSKIEDAKTILVDAISILKGLDRELENLRSDNDALRDWGAYEANRVDELEEELRYLNK